MRSGQEGNEHRLTTFLLQRPPTDGGLRDSRGSLRPRTPRDEAWAQAQAAEKQKDEARLEDFQVREREMSEILRLLREKKEREGGEGKQ
jgi:hypothetical protein